MKKLLVLTAALALFAACNDEITEVNETTGIQMIATGEELDSCAKENAGAMVYVADSNAVYYCAENKWQLLNGKDGADGKDGKDGEPGKNGENGATGKDGVSAKDTVVISKVDTVYVSKTDTLIIKDSVSRVDTLIVSKVDTLLQKDTVVLEYKPVYDTVTTEFLNQEMLAAGEYGILVDKRDNKVYRTVEIGTQTWMAQNLDYSDGGVLSYCQGNLMENCEKFGRLYSWATALNLNSYFDYHRAMTKNGLDSALSTPAQGICPDGYRIPDSVDVNVLINYITETNKDNYDSEPIYVSLKSTAGEEAWKDSLDFAVATDRYGFSAVGSGNRPLSLDYDNPRQEFHFKLVNEIDSIRAYHAGIFIKVESFRVEPTHKDNAMSVRCLKK